MSKKQFTSDLSVKSLENLKKQLMQYRDEYLPSKCKELVTRLMEIGVSTARAKIGESPLGKYVTVTTNISADDAGCTGVLLAKGAVMKHKGYEPFSVLLAIEFGAGVHFNPIENPNADKFGFGVGTFPGQTHAFENTWFYWDEKSQEWKPTHGVKATMPMYEADMKIITNVITIAKEVFD